MSKVLKRIPLLVPVFVLGILISCSRRSIPVGPVYATPTPTPVPTQVFSPTPTLTATPTATVVGTYEFPGWGTPIAISPIPFPVYTWPPTPTPTVPPIPSTDGILIDDFEDQNLVSLQQYPWFTDRGFGSPPTFEAIPRSYVVLSASGADGAESTNAYLEASGEIMPKQICMQLMCMECPYVECNHYEYVEWGVDISNLSIPSSSGISFWIRGDASNQLNWGPEITVEIALSDGTRYSRNIGANSTQTDCWFGQSTLVEAFEPSWVYRSYRFEDFLGSCPSGDTLADHAADIVEIVFKLQTHEYIFSSMVPFNIDIDQLRIY